MDEETKGLRLGCDLCVPGSDQAFYLCALAKDLDGRIWGIVPSHPLTKSDHVGSEVPVMLADRETILGVHRNESLFPEVGDRRFPPFHALLSRFEMDREVLRHVYIDPFWPEAYASSLDTLGMRVLTSEAYIQAEGQGEYAGTIGQVTALGDLVKVKGKVFGETIEVTLDEASSGAAKAGQPLLSETGELIGAALATCGATKYIAPLGDYLVAHHLRLHLPARDRKGLIQAALQDACEFDLLPPESVRRNIEMGWV